MEKKPEDTKAHISYTPGKEYLCRSNRVLFLNQQDKKSNEKQEDGNNRAQPGFKQLVDNRVRIVEKCSQDMGVV